MTSLIVYLGYGALAVVLVMLIALTAVLFNDTMDAVEETIESRRAARPEPVSDSYRGLSRKEVNRILKDMQQIQKRGYGWR